MKLLVCFLTAIGIVAAQSIDQYFPSCSIDCLEKGVKDSSTCDLQDAWCICVYDTYVAVVNDATSCVIQACGSDVAVGEVLPAAVPYCSAATSSHLATASGAAPTASLGSSSTAATTASSPTGSASASRASSVGGSDSSSPSAPTSSSTTTSSTSDNGAAATGGPMGLLAVLAIGAAVI